MMSINPKQQKRKPITEHFCSKKIVTKRKNGTLSVKKCFKNTTSKTEQEHLRSCDINNIVKMPLNNNDFNLTYGDLTDTPDLRDVFKTIHEVRDGFYKLPSDIRKLMENDPSKMVGFLRDPSNTELLVQRGVFKKRETPKINTPDDSKKKTDVVPPKSDKTPDK